MKKILFFILFLGLVWGVEAQTIYRISANGGCTLVKNMTTGVGTCGKLEFSDKVQYIELRFYGTLVSADISELKDENGASLGATNQAVITALGAIVASANGGSTGSVAIGAATEAKQDSAYQRKTLRIENPYSVLASDSTKYRKTLRIENQYSVLATDSTKYRKTLRIENQYSVLATDSTKYRKTLRVATRMEGF